MTSLCGLRSANWSQQGSKSSINLSRFKNSGLWEFDLVPFVLFRPGRCLAIILGPWPGWFVVIGCKFCWHSLSPLERTEEIEWMTFFHIQSNLSTLKVHAHQLNRCWENLSYVDHEFRFFGSLETSCSRTHLAGPILCSSLLQRRFSSDRSSGIILRREFHRVFQKYWKYRIQYSIFHWYCGAIKSPVWESVETLLFLQILYREVTVRSRIQSKVAVLVCLSCLLI